MGVGVTTAGLVQSTYHVDLNSYNVPISDITGKDYLFIKEITKASVKGFVTTVLKKKHGIE